MPFLLLAQAVPKAHTDWGAVIFLVAIGFFCATPFVSWMFLNHLQKNVDEILERIIELIEFKKKMAARQVSDFHAAVADEPIHKELLTHARATHEIVLELRNGSWRPHEEKPS